MSRGLRIGTPGLTTRGMREGEMRTIAGLIDRVLAKPEEEATREAVLGEVRELAAGFPLYADQAAAR